MKIFGKIKNQDKDTFSYNIYILERIMFKLNIISSKIKGNHITISIGIYPVEFGLLFRLWSTGK